MRRHNEQGGRIMAEAFSENVKRHSSSSHHVYDDDTLENMIRYYKIEGNVDSLLAYIKSNRLNEDDDLKVE